MLYSADKARLRRVTAMDYGSYGAMNMVQYEPDNPGPLNVMGAVCYVMDEPALTDTPLSVDRTLAENVNRACSTIGTDERGNELRMEYLHPVLHLIARTAFVVDEGVLAKHSRSDEHGRRYLIWDTHPRIEYSLHEDVEPINKTFAAFLTMSNRKSRADRHMLAIAVAQYVREISAVLQLNVMQMEREYQERVRQAIHAEHRKIVADMDRRRAQLMPLSKFADQVARADVGPDPLFDPDMDENDVLVEVF